MDFVKGILSAVRPGTTAFYLACAIFAVILVTILVNMTKKKQENFSFGSIFSKIADVGKNVGKTVAGTAVNIYNTVKPYNPKFVPRYWNGRTWSCPNGTIDYGDNYNNGNGCLVDKYGPTVNGKCPTNTVPVDSGDQNKKCLAGYSTRTYVGDGKYRCLDWQEDTGRDWSNSDWFTAHQQCKVNNTVFTPPALTTAGWVCPPETTKKTGFVWGDKFVNQDGSIGDGGYAQCQYVNK